MCKAGSKFRHGPPFRQARFTPPQRPVASAEALTSMVSLKPVTVMIQRSMNSSKTTCGSNGPGTLGAEVLRGSGGGVGSSPALRMNSAIGVD